MNIRTSAIKTLGPFFCEVKRLQVKKTKYKGNNYKFLLTSRGFGGEKLADLISWQEMPNFFIFLFFSDQTWVVFFLDNGFNSSLHFTLIWSRRNGLKKFNTRWPNEPFWLKWICFIWNEKNAFWKSKVTVSRIFGEMWIQCNNKSGDSGVSVRIWLKLKNEES